VAVIHVIGNDQEKEVTLTVQLILVYIQRFYDACVINIISLKYFFLSLQIVKYFALSSTHSTPVYF
jgi:hypothetical protein